MKSTRKREKNRGCSNTTVINYDINLKHVFNFSYKIAFLENNYISNRKKSKELTV